MTEKIKFSICIPQYNRIEYLLASLERIELQTYANIEVVVSDDCSRDATESSIKNLIPTYKYPIIYHRNDKNLGYDKNYRQSVHLSTGDYCLVIGNDDTLNEPDAIQFLVDFLKNNDYPDIGFTNFANFTDPANVISRAQDTKVIGSSLEKALRYYSCFSFVGGLIYKKSIFEKYSNDKHDGSIYAQMYLGTLIIASGGKLFSIAETIVLKDIHLKSGDFHTDTYNITLLNRKWRNFKLTDGGLHSVTNVIISAVEDAGQLSTSIIYKILLRMYGITYPHWIIDYRGHKALPSAVGLIAGMYPKRNKAFKSLNLLQKASIFSVYSIGSFTGLIFPPGIFNRFKNRLYTFIKKHI